MENFFSLFFFTTISFVLIHSNDCGIQFYIKYLALAASLQVKLFSLTYKASDLRLCSLEPKFMDLLKTAVLQAFHSHQIQTTFNFFVASIAADRPDAAANYDSNHIFSSCLSSCFLFLKWLCRYAILCLNLHSCLHGVTQVLTFGTPSTTITQVQ